MLRQNQLFLILLGVIIVAGIFAGWIIVSMPGGEVRGLALSERP